MNLDIFKDIYGIEEYWRGKELNKGNQACTYYIARLSNEKYTIFGLDWGNVMSIEASGRFNSYKEARTHLKNYMRFNGVLRKVKNNE